VPLNRQNNADWQMGGRDPTSWLADFALITEIDAVRVANGWSGGYDQQFAIVLPPGITTCFGDGSNTCSDNFFCAYHSYYNVQPGPNVPYASMQIPLQP